MLIKDIWNVIIVVYIRQVIRNKLELFFIWRSIFSLAGHPFFGKTSRRTFYDSMLIGRIENVNTIELLKIS